MITDPIANYLTSIRNAIKAKNSFVYVPLSKEKEKITQILKDQGYIENYQKEEEPKPQGRIKILLKYGRNRTNPAIVSIDRISKPGLRKYCKLEDIPYIAKGLGTVILSTSKGIVTGKDARRVKVGGELLCSIF